MEKSNNTNKLILENKKINFLYEIKETWQAGMILFGDEVKSIKNNKVNLNDSYVRVSKDNYPEIQNLNIGLYKKSNPNNIKHKPNRSIRLLLNKKEIE